MIAVMRKFGIAAVFCLAGLILSGCADGNWGRKREIPPEAPPKPRAAADNVLGDTIGAYTLVGMGQPENLRGFGVVIGLGENGGSDCPSTVREYLLDYMAREFAPRDSSIPRPKYTPAEMLDSLDTTVVSVFGLVPPGAPTGTHFDLHVEAVGTQTRSLEGGVLVLCELKRFGVDVEGKGLVSGRTLARGRGLIYSDSKEDENPEQALQNARRGYVLGGGRTVTNRNTRLMLLEPSYWMARKIRDRINERFRQDPPVADAMSQGYLVLTTPQDYEQDPRYFMDLVSHLYLENNSVQIERKLQLLTRELDGNDETLNHIALVWEALGRTVIPHIQSLYEHANPSVRYYAARAGLRLKDVNAVAPLARIAADPDQSNRLLAVNELGSCDLPLATRRLVDLLNDPDEQVRIAAYKGLLRHPHPRIETRRYLSVQDPTQYNLTLDIVDSKASPLIYVQRTGEPRIAVFGRDTTIVLPIFYNHPGDWVTLNALEDQTDITMLWRTRQGTSTGEPLHIEPKVVALLEALGRLPAGRKNETPAGIGLNYSRIVEVLQTLCGSGSIPAKLVLQPAPLLDMYGPQERPERAETDAPEPTPDAAEPDTWDTKTESEEDTEWQRTE